jgi:cation diffusion facilitator CzcD-associated flavoprotein CzcO
MLIIGNALSGRDIAEELLKVAQLPVYVSRRHKSIGRDQIPNEGLNGGLSSRSMWLSQVK